MKFKEEQELADLAERVDVIKRTQSVAEALLDRPGRTASRFMSVTAGNMRSASSNDLPFGYKGAAYQQNQARETGNLGTAGISSTDVIKEEDEISNSDASNKPQVYQSQRDFNKTRDPSYSLQRKSELDPEE